MIHYTIAPVRLQQAVDAETFHHYTLDDGTIWTEFYRTPTGYLLRFPDIADYEVSADGRKVTARPTEDADVPTVEHLYLNQIVPLALSRQGKPAFHASVVTVSGGSIAFLGTAGAGKSTLAASFALHDAAFLTDDSLLIDELDGFCWALPSHASLRLWEDSVDELVAEDTARNAAISYSSKARLLAGDTLTHMDKPQRLVAAYLLNTLEPDEVCITPISGTERQMAWVQNSFLLDIEDRDLLARHFEWTHRIASAVPTFALDYLRDYGILPDVRLAITGHAESLGSRNGS